MSPAEKDPVPQEDAQGSLFEVTFRGNGSTDPNSYGVEATLTPAPEGVYPEASSEEQSDQEPTDESRLVSEAVRKAKRHKAQLGLHSPLARNGTYSGTLQVGDYLPGFGPVTYTNLEHAKERARHLDERREK